MSMIHDDLKARGARQPRPRIEYEFTSRARDWRSVGAIAGLSGGVVSALIGSLLTAFSWLTGAAGAVARVRTAGTILLLLTIPLLVLGAHCLDLTEKRKSAVKRSNTC
jgi:hypothetical protein